MRSSATELACVTDADDLTEENEQMSRGSRWVGRIALCAACFTSLPVVSCGPPCRSESPQAERAWETAVKKMKVLELEPNDAISIKRDVHNIVIDADAAEVAKAFNDVMIDTSRHFGLIKLQRMKANEGKPFSVGERFQGQYTITLAKAEWPKFWQKVFDWAYEDDRVQLVICEIQNGLLSDYGELSLLELDPKPGEPYRMQYKYLGHKDPKSGSPIAGSSMFVVTPIVDMKELQALGVSKAARLTQIFEYQEQTDFFAYFFSAGGLKLHNQVVYSQAKQAAELIGAKIVDTDIPKEYQEGL